jgi:hypothetical protein
VVYIREEHLTWPFFFFFFFLDGCNIQISAGWNGTQDNNGKKKNKKRDGQESGMMRR